MMDEMGQKTGMVVLMYSEYQGGGGREGGMLVQGRGFYACGGRRKILGIPSSG